MQTQVRLLTAEMDRMIRAVNGQDIRVLYNRAKDYWVICQELPEARPVDKRLIGCDAIRGAFSRYKALVTMVTKEGIRMDPSPLNVKALLDLETRRADDPRNEVDLTLDSPHVEGPDEVPNPRWQRKAADVWYDRFREETPDQKDRERDAIKYILPIEFGGKESRYFSMPGETPNPPAQRKALILPKGAAAPVKTEEELDWNDDSNW